MHTPTAAALSSRTGRTHRVVVVGGGTGTFTLLRGLKRYADRLDLTAIVTMADSGGSTGRLRDEFGQLPVGDVRMALTALAADADTHDELLRQLFLYRFAKGEGLAGHNFGNLLLTALTDILGSEVEAITAAARILRVAGAVVPVTADHADLRATYADGSVIVGEHAIETDSARAVPRGRITQLALTPRATIAPAAAAALQDADVIVCGPGDLYTSVLANCVVDGFVEALATTQAQVVYVANLMTKVGQTTDFGVAEHVAELTRYCQRAPDVVIANTASFPAAAAARYAAEGEYPVVQNYQPTAQQILYAEPVVATELVTTPAGDRLRRSLIRHDSDRLAQIVWRLLA